VADLPAKQLSFTGGCPDCGVREVLLPPPLPDAGDDFDWKVRDYDGFRRFLLEDLAARFPTRTRWTSADLEVVVVEVLSAVLDQLSDMADRVAAEAYLGTARRPESVRRLLSFIGYDAVARNRARLSGSALGETQELDRLWLHRPDLMDEARREGPREIRTQRRMVTVEDHATQLEEHPLVSRAQARSTWTGTWNTVEVAVIGVDGLRLDDPVPVELQESVEDLHLEHDLEEPSWVESPCVRTLLGEFVRAYRMVGQEVLLRDVTEVGVLISLSIEVADNYYRSELRDAVTDALGTGGDGFFRAGRLRFGEDLHASDVIHAVMSVEGVKWVCLNRFKRVGGQFFDQSESGRIVLSGIEVAVCDNDSAHPEKGHLRLTLHGGRRG
jgi:hypothetical protein